jgi:putative transposase
MAWGQTRQLDTRRNRRNRNGGGSGAWLWRSAYRSLTNSARDSGRISSNGIITTTGIFRHEQYKGTDACSKSSPLKKRGYCRVTTRPLRLQFAGALHHVTSRGGHREAIYRDHRDRLAWLNTLQLVYKRFNFVVHAFYQMTNHYHVLVETVDGNLSQGMRQLNGLYTQHFNRRHFVVGHLFQGRYKAILVQKESYLLELTRYVVLNLLGARMVASLDEWPWSSHHYLLGLEPAPAWLDTEWLLGQFGTSRSAAVTAYIQFVMDGVGLDSPLRATSHQLLLGDDEFVASRQKLALQESLRDVSKAQRRSIALPIEEYEVRYANRKEAMAKAYGSAAFTMAQIGEYFGVSERTVSRAVRKFES